ncbi:MAG: phenylalanine--tRNA ligase subunit beta [Parcubacteria group bacterium]|nr:MAG: phenylalanine--tRNA ligase subunit beta [Parcubacteria group bacterium]
MYLSLNWVKKWLKLPNGLSAEQLALDFTMSTVEVEKIIQQAKNLENIVVGRVEEITKHPQADKLEVCRVDVGDSSLQIVCGGTNLSKGMLVAVAKVGAKVKWHGEGELVVLTKAKIRGVESYGMIAAASEIGLVDLFPSQSDHEILDLSAFNLKVGQNLSQALELDDTIIDIENKSINHRPDLWGQYGLARELAAIYKINLKPYSRLPIKPQSKDLALKVTVEDTANCYRYMAVGLKNIKIEDSPWWLKKSLEAVGIRPINNIVDVTNYVMYELGQPLHAFDARQIDRQHIFVKGAKKGESFVTLDGKKRKLPEGALMISDQNKYIALAGIMGGQNSEIASDTSQIIIESANFKASSIRRTSMDLGLRTESSARFEKALDPVLAELALQKAVEIIIALNPGAIAASEVIDVSHSPYIVKIIEVSEALINQRFGSPIPTKEIKDILKRLQFGVNHRAGKFVIQVPSWRATKDISIAEDIVEEVARIYGYDNIAPTLPTVVLHEPSYDIASSTARDLRTYLAYAQSYTEVYTYAFTDVGWVPKLGLKLADHIKVKNAVSPEQSYMNLSLLPNLLKKAEENMRWYDHFKIFELQRVFDKNSKGTYHIDQQKNKFLPRQPMMLAGVELSRVSGEEAFLSAKGLIESLRDYFNIDWQSEKIDLPYAALAYQIKYQDLALGEFGILDSKLFDSGPNKVMVAWWQLSFETLLKYINENKSYSALAKFPVIKRDMSIIVGQSVAWQDIESEIYKVSPLIKHLEPFDVFIGEAIGHGKRSIAYHLEFRSEERTLASDEIDDLMKKIISNLQKKFKADLR